MKVDTSCPPSTPLSHEFAGLNLPDVRLNRRVLLTSEAWSSNPQQSLPQAMGSTAMVEGAYRLFNNARVHGSQVVEPHLNATWERASQSQRWVLSLEDTSEMRFGGDVEREGLGELLNGGQGFYLHLSLIASESPTGRFVISNGVGAYELLVRKRGQKKKPWKQRVRDPERESMRWHRVAEEVDERAAKAGVSVIHVCDREGDDYAFLDSLLARGSRFVIRNAYNRREGARTGSKSSQGYLWDLVSTAKPVLATREVEFEARKSSGGRKRQEPRSKRTTTLEVRAAAASILRPDDTSSRTRRLNLNIVAVTEVSPPDGETPISWMLLTTECIETDADVLRVLDAYRARWTIEEYFKALKTGCRYEQLQLESLHALHNALGLCMPMAWRMLHLRSYARDFPEAPADQVLEPKYLEVLVAIAAKQKNKWGLKLKRDPKAVDVLYAVARLGGHLKNNGAPGWLTLSRGFHTLDGILEAAALLGGREM
jgi:hypothetical protein